MGNQESPKKHIFGKRLSPRGGFGIVISVIVFAAIVYITTHHKSSNSITQPLPEYNEQGTKQWSDADKYLPEQSFTLNTNQDTVIQTQGGLVIAVPANCFLGDDGKPVSGPIDFEVKEALDASSMMKAGLSTKSGNKLLESAGMFYLNGRKDGKSLKIDPNHGIYVHVPADSVKSGMQAFEGQRMPDGSIDWVNPKPLIHNLVPVNIHSLNFYPPLYLDSLALWGKDVHNKKYTDSLYYSFASLFGAQDIVQDTIDHFKYRLEDIDAGMVIFNANCTPCHTSTNKKLVGPGMADITERVPQPYWKWLEKYIKNYIVVLKSGDVYANKIHKENKGGAMAVFDKTLSNKQIHDLIAYLNTLYTADIFPTDTVASIAPVSDSIDDAWGFPHDGMDTARSVCGINPAKIKSIWNDEFQNTLISTREFEERMPYIHKTGNAAILDLYVNNLDKNLSYIDSLAAGQLSRDLKTVFLSFAARGDGKVAVKSSLLEKLKSFFERKTKLFTEAATKAQNDFIEKQNKLNDKATNKENAEEERDGKREAQLRGDEYKQNFKEACRQIGCADSACKVNKNGYAVLCTGTGWINLDAYVEESTLNRTTLNYTSPENRKTAIIKYLPFSVTINDYSKYDKVLVYLLPNKLNSFMRINDVNGKFKENLDELFSYKMECIAYKGDQAYYYSMDAVQPKDYDAITLEPISINDLDKKLNEEGNKDQKNDMAKEIEYMQFEAKDRQRQKQNEEMADFRNKVEKVIFPCYLEGEQQGGQNLSGELFH